MGLETVEIVMDLEDEFKIHFDDYELEKAQTIGQTVDLVVRMLNSSPRPAQVPHCASARVFYQVRRELISECGVPMNSVRPDSRLCELVPPGPQRAPWRDIARRCGLPKPSFNPLKPFSHPFPGRRVTLRRLIRNGSLARFYKSDGTVNVAVVSRQVFEIVARQAGVSREKLLPETRYYPDLF